MGNKKKNIKKLPLNIAFPKGMTVWGYKNESLRDDILADAVVQAGGRVENKFEEGSKGFAQYNYRKDKRLPSADELASFDR